MGKNVAMWNISAYNRKETSRATTKRKEAKEGKNCIVGVKFYVARVPRFPLTWEVETVKKLLDLNGKRS